MQPGPFELDNSVYVEVQNQEYNIRVKKLINFYTSFGFNLIKNKVFSVPLQVVYSAVGLPENATLLMVYNHTRD